MTSLRNGRTTISGARASARGIALVAAAFTVQATSGCISNEYRIQKDELQRLTELPPETRGHAVRVSQQLGSRRDDAVDEPVGYTSNSGIDDVYVQLDLNGSTAGGGAPRSSGAPNGWQGTPPATSWRGTP